MKGLLNVLIGFLLVTSIACADAETEALNKETTEESEFHAQFTNALDSMDIDSTKSYVALKRLEKAINRSNFEDTVRSLYDEIGLKDLNLKYKVFRHAMVGYFSLRQDGKLKNEDLLSIIDFSQSSCNKRFYTVNLKTKEVLFNTLVSHGRNTGGDKATKFSNVNGSNQSSLGFYVTGETYTGSKGYSLRLDGQEPGFNDKIRQRAVVMHKADYVSDEWVKKYGRIGRSQGCPALPVKISKKVINAIKNKTAIFAYYDDQNYLKVSKYLNLEKLMETLDKDNFDVKKSGANS